MSRAGPSAVESETPAFGLDDASLLFGDRCDSFRLVDARDVHRIGADLLELAAADVLVEERGLGGEDLEHSLVDTVFGEKAVHVDGARLSHPMTARDCLLL